MKNTIRIGAIIGALIVVAALGVSAFAAGTGDPSRSPRTPSAGVDSRTMSPGAPARHDAVQEVRGNCDEAEHANDPACQGGSMAGMDDNSGPGDDDADEIGDDSSGPSENEGPGNMDDDQGDDQSDDQSGPDDGNEDHSGSGGGDDDLIAA